MISSFAWLNVLQTKKAEQMNVNFSFHTWFRSRKGDRLHENWTFLLWGRLFRSCFAIHNEHHFSFRSLLIGHKNLHKFIPATFWLTQTRWNLSFWKIKYRHDEVPSVCTNRLKLNTSFTINNFFHLFHDRWYIHEDYNNGDVMMMMMIALLLSLFWKMRAKHF